jgi:hypothetical protein
MYFVAFPNQPQILQNPAKPGQAQAKRMKEKRLGFPWISLGGNEPFQWVIVTPLGRKIFLGSIPFQLASHSRTLGPEHPSR